MTTLLEIPDEELEAIRAVTAKLGISQEDFLRRAVTASLVPYREPQPTPIDAFFGVLAGKIEDGLVFQERIRSEWER